MLAGTEEHYEVEVSSIAMRKKIKERNFEEKDVSHVQLLLNKGEEIVGNLTD